MKKISGTLLALLLWAGSAVFLPSSTNAQTKAGEKGAPATKAAPKAAAKAPAGGPPANMIQIMRGIFYPASNVIFAAQATNPDEIKPAKDASTAVNPLESAYGKWTAVENAGMALADGAALLRIAGRRCANGVAAPLNNPDWPKFVTGLREAGLKVYEAAKAKDQDKILDAADAMTTACSNCHEKWRDVEPLSNRCK